MRALIKENPTEGYALKEIPIPEPGEDELVFKVERVAICGSDIALYEWNEVAKVIATVPFIPGHEATGTVVAVGKNVSSISIGSRIAIENHFFCGNCYSCKDDRGDICKNMDQYGHGRGTMHGGFCEFSLVKAKYCYVIKTDITADEAALLEPMGVAHNGLEHIDIEGHDVLIIGAGPIGLLAASVAKALGSVRVIVADINESRLELSLKMGADVIINVKNTDLKEEILKLTNGDGIARLVEASGASQMLNTSFSLLRKGAKVALIGLCKQPLHVDNFLQDILFKSITLKTIHGRRIFHTWQECEKLISQKKVDPTLIISHRFGMSDWEEAFKHLMSGSACKIVVDPQI